jgi:hypothetical protein
MKRIVGKKFGEVTCKHKDQVITLASISNCIRVANKKADTDPLTIFQRVCIKKQSDKELKGHFKYELAPFPISLFSEEGMMKETKSSL